MLKRIIRDSIFATMYYVYFLWYKIIGPPNVLLLRGSMNNDILKAFGAKIGTNVTILPPLTMASVRQNNGYGNLSVGNNCIIGGNVFFDLADRIILEDGVSIGPGVIIMTHNKYNNNVFLEERLAGSCGKKEVVIKKGSGIKAGALIVHGITIGENVVVAGNAVINRDVPSNCFVAGIPAKIIKEFV
jgi:acetyltransferase-like isoleucine patch superfamily enzyme